MWLPFVRLSPVWLPFVRLSRINVDHAGGAALWVGASGGVGRTPGMGAAAEWGRLPA